MSDKENNAIKMLLKCFAGEGRGLELWEFSENEYVQRL